MADQKISELTALTGANVADDDAIAIVDTSATETKKIVFSELKNALDTATGFVRITGDTMTGDLNVLANVGIGTSSPSRKLSVYDSSAPYLALQNSTSGSASGDGFQVQLAAANSYLWNYENGFTSFGTNNTEAMRIDSSGNIGVGTSSPVTSYKNALQVHGADGGGNIRITNDTTGTGTGNGFEAVVVGVDAYLIQREAAPLIFYTSSTERMRIDSSGNVGIGTSSPSYPLHVSGTGDKVMAVTAGASSIAALNLGNSTNLADGGIRYDNSADALILRASNAEKMRIDSSGNLLVGKTVQGLTNAGFEVAPSGQASATQSGASALRLNRLSSDGEILQFRKDGSAVGSIGVANNDIYIGTGDTTLSFIDGSNDIKPTGTNGAQRSDAISLGDANNRFKDLYLSGGVYLGGTGAANKLDDYEEGTWTPTWLGTSSNPTVSYDTQEGRYVKIGSFVYVKVRLDIASSSGGSGTLLLDGLPFTATNDSGALGVASLGYKTGFVSQGPDFGRTNSTYIEMYYDNGTAEVAVVPTNLGSGTQCIFTAVYNTTA